MIKQSSTRVNGSRSGNGAALLLSVPATPIPPTNAVMPSADADAAHSDNPPMQESSEVVAMLFGKLSFDQRRGAFNGNSIPPPSRPPSPQSTPQARLSWPRLYSPTTCKARRKRSSPRHRSQVCSHRIIFVDFNLSASDDFSRCCYHNVYYISQRIRVGLVSGLYTRLHKSTSHLETLSTDRIHSGCKRFSEHSVSP